MRRWERIKASEAPVRAYRRRLWHRTWVVDGVVFCLCLAVMLWPLPENAGANIGGGLAVMELLLLAPLNLVPLLASPSRRILTEALWGLGVALLIPLARMLVVGVFEEIAASGR